MIPWLQTVVDEAHARLVALPPEHPAHCYLRSRGVAPSYLRPQDVAAYKIGWLDMPQSVRACSPEFWDWVCRYGYDRLVFPLTDPLGHAIGIETRTITRKDTKDFVAQPKELCPPCFGLHVALPVAFETQRLIVTEGVFDALSVRAYTPEVVAVLTSSPTNAMKRLFSRYVTCVVALLDMDKWGRRGCYRLAGLPFPPELRDPKDPVERRITAPPPYQVLFPPYTMHDPNDLALAGKFEELRRLAGLGKTLQTAQM